MTRVTSCLAVLVLVAASGVRAQEPAPPSGQRAEGLALEVTVKEALTLVSSGGSSTNINNFILLGEPVGKIFLGWKSGRLVIGAGFELTRLSSESGSSGSGSSGNSSSASQTQVLFMPGLRWSCASSADQRVEAILSLSLGIGHTFSDTSSSNSGGPSSGSSSNYRFVYELGPGLRYWLHPQFALGATAGLRGDYFHSSFDSGGNPSYGSSNTLGVTSIFTALDLLGVF